MKIAVVTSIPTPYRDAFWTEFQRLPGVSLDVYYCAFDKVDRPWSVNWPLPKGHEVLAGRNLLRFRGHGASLYWNPGIRRRLIAGNYDAVLVGGYNHLTMLSAVRWCQQRRVPYFLMCETHEIRDEWGIKAWVRRRLVNWVVSGAAGCFPTGELAKRFLVHHGAPPDGIMCLPNVPDVDSIAESVASRRAIRGELRNRYGLDPDVPTVLFVGRLIPKKRAADLIAAIRHLAETQSLQALIVGDGPERHALETAASSLEGTTVRFAGFVEPRDVVDVYALSDIFVLPSHETWGVVVIEALAAGLHVVVSDRVGCHPDVDKKVSVFPFGDVGGLVQSIEDISLRNRAGLQGCLLDEGWSATALASRVADHVTRRTECIDGDLQGRAPAVANAL